MDKDAVQTGPGFYNDDSNQLSSSHDGLENNFQMFNRGSIREGSIRSNAALRDDAEKHESRGRSFKQANRVVDADDSDVIDTQQSPHEQKKINFDNFTNLNDGNPKRNSDAATNGNGLVSSRRISISSREDTLNFDQDDQKAADHSQRKAIDTSMMRKLSDGEDDSVASEVWDQDATDR